MIGDIGHLFMYGFPFKYVLWKKRPFSSFAHFKIGFIVFAIELCKVQFWQGRKGKTTSTEVGYLYSGKDGRQSA